MRLEVIAKAWVGDERERSGRKKREISKVGGYRLAFSVADEATEEVGPDVVCAWEMNRAHIQVVERADERNAAPELHQLRGIRGARGNDGDCDGVVAGK